jgi:2'-5' RNA ligase
MSSSLYFIALVLPEPAQGAVERWKQKMELLYGCKAQYKSPAHITLMPPFGLGREQEKDLRELLEILSAEMHVMELELNGFGFFEEHVVYLKVEKNEALMQLNRRVGELMKERLGVHKPGFFDHPFRPHVTIAHRDLKMADFRKARKMLENEEFHCSFVVNKVDLLRHNGTRWDVM